MESSSEWDSSAGQKDGCEKQQSAFSTQHLNRQEPEPGLLFGDLH
jgi:hypothetical protein